MPKKYDRTSRFQYIHDVLEEQAAFCEEQQAAAIDEEPWRYRLYRLHHALNHLKVLGGHVKDDDSGNEKGKGVE